MLSVVVAVFVAVLVAELVGDKTLYTLGALATRYRVISVLAGASVAFMGKTLVAVLFGGFIASLPEWLIAVTSAITFLAMAVVLWRKKPMTAETTPVVVDSFPRGASAGFTAIFFSEWADVGQITTALLVARYQRPFSVFFGATLAMIVKATFAVTAGLGLRRWVPSRVVRLVSVSLCVLMAVLAAFRVD
ncbi:MAG: TMEM165/GDT1 family protein [Polyangiales bacterium]